MRRPLSLVLLLLVPLVAVGCRRSDGPADRYERFADAARTGNAAAVWEMLAKRSRDALDARAKELAAKAPGVVPASGRELVLGDLAARAPRVKSAVVLRESKDMAVLTVEDEGGAKGEVMLVREDGAWRVVVPGLDVGRP
jgi:hypothetical protein